jgi:hypothetical protein
MPKFLKNTLIATMYLCLAGWLLPATQVCAQAVRNSADVSELRAMTRRSGAIFAGRVIAIQFLRPRFNGEVPTVRITFRVERGIRGPRTGSQFVLREWAALWNGGQRYSMGERVLLFLYPASRVGLTSSVGGEHGRFRLDGKGQLIVDTERAKLFDDLQKRMQERPGAPRTRIPINEVSRRIRGLVAGEE